VFRNTSAGQIPIFLWAVSTFLSRVLCVTDVYIVTRSWLLRLPDAKSSPVHIHLPNYDTRLPFQYTMNLLYEDVTVRNNVEEESDPPQHPLPISLQLRICNINS